MSSLVCPPQTRDPSPPTSQTPPPASPSTSALASSTSLPAGRRDPPSRSASRSFAIRRSPPPTGPERSRRPTGRYWRRRRRSAPGWRRRTRSPSTRRSPSSTPYSVQVSLDFSSARVPADVIFIADPEGSMMGAGSSIGPYFVGQGTAEMRLAGALREVLAGGHLGYEEVQGVLRDVLPLNSEDEKSEKVSEALLSAFLIGQRMNRETDRELKAYCLAFDDELGAPPVADVRFLTHYGEPYDGNTHFFRSTLFVAAVRACYGESCLLHGVEWMAPKVFRGAYRRAVA